MRVFMFFLMLTLAARAGLVVDGVRWPASAEMADMAAFEGHTNNTAIHLSSSQVKALIENAAGETNLYPVFVIPISGWSEIELKASTNNFTAATLPVTQKLAYWYESLGTEALTEWAEYQHSDLGARLFYCDPDVNQRAWVMKTNTVSLTEALGANGGLLETVVVSPSRVLQDGSTNLWMRPDNQNVVWSYRRRTAVAGETNRLGKTVWHPVWPVEWRARQLEIQ